MFPNFHQRYWLWGGKEGAHRDRFNLESSAHPGRGRVCNAQSRNHDTNLVTWRSNSTKGNDGFSSVGLFQGIWSITFLSDFCFSFRKLSSLFSKKEKKWHQLYTWKNILRAKGEHSSEGKWGGLIARWPGILKDEDREIKGNGARIVILGSWAAITTKSFNKYKEKIKKIKNYYPSLGSL